jgi:hypothetical protein
VGIAGQARLHFQKAGGMKALAVGSAAGDMRADLSATDLSKISIKEMINL